MQLVEQEQKDTVYSLDQFWFRPSLGQEEFVLGLREFQSMVVFLCIGLSTAIGYFLLSNILIYYKN